MKPKTAGRTTGASHDANPMRAVETAECDAAGTRTCGIAPEATIVTINGMCRAQDLRAGDKLVTRGQGAVPIRTIEQHSVVVRAVYIIAGSLGHNQPDRDTLLPAAQLVHIRDWRVQFFGKTDSMLVPAGKLVDGEYVRDIGFIPLTLYRITCDRPQIFYADGMELGTANAFSTAINVAHARQGV